MEKPSEWSPSERLRVIERILYRIGAERLNIDRRSRLINLALDVASGAPELIDRKWPEVCGYLGKGEADGMTF